MQNTVRKPTRDKQINIRATDEERAVIDYAASLVNKIERILLLRRLYMRLRTSFWISVYSFWMMPVIRPSSNSLKRLYKMLRAASV